METICCWRQYKLAQRPNNNGTFLLYLKGKDGENGITPHVGENGNWYIGNRDTNFPAQGQKEKMVKTEHPLILVLMETGGSIHPIQK